MASSKVTKGLMGSARIIVMSLAGGQEVEDGESVGVHLGQLNGALARGKNLGIKKFGKFWGPQS